MVEIFRSEVRSVKIRGLKFPGNRPLRSRVIRKNPGVVGVPHTLTRINVSKSLEVAFYQRTANNFGLMGIGKI